MNNPYKNLKQYEGQSLKYSVLCKIINEKPCGGNAKKAHLKRISKYVDIEQDSGKIYIHKVYDENDELQIIENHGKFTSYIRQFLINMFCELKHKNNISTIILTNRDILEMTYMVNNQYFLGKALPYKYLESFSLNINKNSFPDKNYLSQKILNETDIFFSSSYRLLKRVIYDSLVSLEKKSLIQKNKTFRLYKNYTDENGKYISIEKNCTEEDISRILSVQHKSIREFNSSISFDDTQDKRFFLKNIQSVRYLYPQQRKQFYKILNNNIINEFKNEGWNAYSVAWKINLANSESFEYEAEKINYNQLNINVQDKLLSAKDLQIIEDSLRKQFVNTFIRI